jgi:hypothetical protein
MPVVPSKSVEKIKFYETHQAQWEANAAAMGTTPEAVSALADLTVAAREAFNEQRQAQNAARAATAKLQQAVEAMANAGAAIIEQVRVQARKSGDEVYPLAHIPAPARPSPIGPPGQPYRFSVELSEVGSVTLRWKCKNPAGAVGTVYQVWRRIGTGELTFLATVGAKQFVDDTLPAGTAAVMYQVQGMRTTAVGPVAQFNVYFGGGKLESAQNRPTRVAA